MSSSYIPLVRKPPNAVGTRIKKKSVRYLHKRSTLTPMEIAIKPLLNPVWKPKLNPARIYGRKLIAGLHANCKFEDPIDRLRKSQPYPPLPYIQLECIDGPFSSSSSQEESEVEEERISESNQFGTYDYKEEGISEEESDGSDDPEAEEQVPPVAMTRESIASEEVRAAMRKLSRMEFLRGKQEFQNPRASFVQCPKGGGPNLTYSRRNIPGPFLYCPVSHLQNDNFAKLPFSTKPKPVHENWRRPVHLKPKLEKGYKECSKCDQVYMNVLSHPDQIYEDYKTQVTYQNISLEEEAFAYEQVVEFEMSNWGNLIPVYPKRLRKVALGSYGGKRKLYLSKSQKLTIQRHHEETTTKRLLSAKNKLEKFLKPSGPFLRYTRSEGDNMTAKYKRLEKKTQSYANVTHVVPNHVFKKRKPRPQPEPMIEWFIKSSNPTTIASTLPVSTNKKKGSKSGRGDSNPVRESGDGSENKAEKSKVKAEEIEPEEKTEWSSSSNSKMDPSGGEESDSSYEDANAEFRKPNGDFDDEKYRQCVVDMLVQDLKENIKLEKEKKKKRVTRKKRKAKDPYEHVQSKVDSKRPACMHKHKASKQQSQAAGTSVKKPKKVKGQKKTKGSSSRSSSKSTTFDPSIFEATRNEVLKEMEEELRMKSDHYLSIPRDLSL